MATDERLASSALVFSMDLLQELKATTSTLLGLNDESCFEALKPPPPPTVAPGPLRLFRILAATSILHNSKEIFDVVTPLWSNDPLRIGCQRRTSGLVISSLRLAGVGSYDDMTPSPVGGKLKQSAEGTQEVPGLIEARVYGTDEVWELLQSSSLEVELDLLDQLMLMNSVVTHTVGENLINGQRTRSHLWLVDLAGSESLRGWGGLKLKVCIIPFRGDAAEVLLPPSRLEVLRNSSSPSSLEVELDLGGSTNANELSSHSTRGLQVCIYSFRWRCRQKFLLASSPGQSSMAKKRQRLERAFAVGGFSA
nr:kinesin-like protein KIFC3 [Ipomoea batatas]